MFLIRFAAAVAALSYQVDAVYAQGAEFTELTVNPVLYEPLETANSAAVVVAVRPVNGTEVTEINKETYQIRGSRGIWKDVHLTILHSPDGYVPLPLHIRVPFYVQNLDVYAVAINSRTGDSKEVRWLRDRDPRFLRGTDLFVYFARAKRQFDHYIGKMPAGSRDSVKAIYSYLQVSERLMNEHFIVSARELERGASWLEEAMASNSNVVNSAVGVANAQQIVGKVRSLVPEQYVAVWSRIRQYADVDEEYYCKSVEDLQNDLVGKTEGDKKIISQHKRLGPILSTAYAQCLGQKYQRSRERSEELADKLRLQMLILADQKEYLSEGEIEWADKIESRIKELGEIRAAVGSLQG